MPRACTDPLVRHKEWKSDVRFGTWNVVSLYRSGSITAAAREIARCKLDLVGMKEVKKDKEGTVTLEIIFFLWKRKPKSSTENDFLYSIEWYQKLEGTVC